MNRKLVNGLLLLALASGGCGVFTSCKDTNEDFYNKVVAGQVDLGDRVADLEKYTGYVKGWTQTIPDMISANTNEINGLKTKLAALETSGSATEAEINGVKNDIADLVNKNAALKGDLESLQTVVAALEAKLADYKPGITQADLDEAIQGLQVMLQNNIEALKLDVAANSIKIGDLESQLNTVSSELTTLTTDLGEAKTQLANTAAEVLRNTERLDALSETLDNLALEFGDLYAEINDEGGIRDDIRNLNAQVESALGDIDTLYQLVETNQQNIKELQNLTAKYFTNINEVLNLRVSDILLNQTWNPMFGALNLPFGLATTIAANYYGYSDHQLNFPLDIYSTDYEVLHDNSGINKIGQAALNNLLSSLKAEGQILVNAEKVYMNDGENNLGQLYLSINPTHIDTKNIKFELVTSAGKTAPIDVNVVESDKELTFGASRSAANGFYQANLHVDAANAPEIGIRVQEGLKSAMKDALTGHTKSDFAQLAKVLMQQMQDILPAYGVKATWDEPSTTFPNASETPVTRTYISKYEVAATAMRPLGYHFMEGEGAKKDLLPTVGSLKEAFDKAFDEIGNKIKIKLDLTGISEDKINTIKDFEINLDGVGVSFNDTSIEIDLNGQTLKTYNPDGTAADDIIIGGAKGTPQWSQDNVITLEYKAGQVVNGVQQPGTGELAGLINQILDQVNGLFQGDDSIEAKLNAQIKSQLTNQVSDMLEELNGQLTGLNGSIDEQLKNVLADIKNTLLGKLGRVDNLVDKYNKIANKVNEFLKDPNHYLQVTMFYNAGNGNLGELSSNINYPTHFKTAGGNALTLYATSYTAELIAPSYKKYVAVSRAWKADGTEVTFNENGGPAAANATEFLNEVRPGNQQRFALDTKNLQKGYKYEVIYSSLDYQGYTSTRTFYLVVD